MVQFKILQDREGYSLYYKNDLFYPKWVVHRKGYKDHWNNIDEIKMEAESILNDTVNRYGALVEEFEL